MLEACAEIVTFTRGLNYELFLGDRQRMLATAFGFAALGEAVKRLSPEFRNQHAEIRWQKIAGMRDRLIHGYDKIDFELVWNTASLDVPVLLEQLRKIRSGLD